MNPGRFQTLALILSVTACMAEPTPVPSPSPQPTPYRPARLPFDTGDKSTCLIYLLMGGSNMVGADARPLATQTPDSRIGFLDRDGKWLVAIEPIHEKGAGIGPGIFFAREMLRRDPSARIVFIPLAVEDSPLDRWEKGSHFYEEAIRRVRIAAPSGEIAGVLWHQGEADSYTAATAASYEMRLTQMFRDLRTDLNAPSLPIVVGQLAPFDRTPFAEVIRCSLRRVPHDLPMVGFADSAGLTDLGDWRHVHFDAASQETLGKNYASAMLKLQDVSAAGKARAGQN